MAYHERKESMKESQAKKLRCEVRVGEEKAQEVSEAGSSTADAARARLGVRYSDPRYPSDSKRSRSTHKMRPWRSSGLQMGRLSAFCVAGSTAGRPRQIKVMSSSSESE